MSTLGDAILVDATGHVFVEHEGKEITLKVGDSIYESDVINTGPDSTAEIEFRDGAVSHLFPNTELTLSDFDFGPGEEPSFVMNLAEGAMRTVSGKVVELNPDAFEVITPNAVVGIRGTEFITSVRDGKEVHALVFISGGKVLVVTREDGSRVELTGSNQLVSFLQGDMGPIRIEQYTNDEFNQAMDSIDRNLMGVGPKQSGDEENREEQSNESGEEAEQSAEAGEEVEQSTESSDGGLHVSTVVLFGQESEATQAISNSLTQGGLDVSNETGSLAEDDTALLNQLEEIFAEAVAEISPDLTETNPGTTPGTNPGTGSGTTPGTDPDPDPDQPPLNKVYFEGDYDDLTKGKFSPTTEYGSASRLMGL